MTASTKGCLEKIPRSSQELGTHLKLLVGQLYIIFAYPTTASPDGFNLEKQDFHYGAFFMSAGMKM